MNIKKEYFDNQVKAIYRASEKGTLLNRHKEILKYVRRYCDKKSRILDIGCFDGKILKALEKDGYENLYALDFSQVSENSFKNSSIQFQPYDIENDKIPFKEKFDAIIYSDVLEHLILPKIVLSEARKNLTPKGKVIISVPNAGWFLNGTLLSFFPSKLFLSAAFGPWSHTSQFTFYQFKSLTEDLGFKKVELAGGKMDNFVFHQGFKKVAYDIFIEFLNQLALLWPQIFSDHIFAVFQNMKVK